MGEIIQLHDPHRIPPDNLLCLAPWEFRRADWGVAYIVQMSKAAAAQLERQRAEAYRRGFQGTAEIPAHLALTDGPRDTVLALLAHRADEDSMREIYYLAGLTDTMINQVSGILRSDLIRAVYKTVLELKTRYRVFWHPPLQDVLLPFDPQHFNLAAYRASLREVESLKAFYRAVHTATDTMFEVLAHHYVFYL